MMLWSHPTLLTALRWANVPNCWSLVIAKVGGFPMEPSVFGIDLAKRVFELHGSDARGRKVLSKRPTRKKVMMTDIAG